MCGLALIGDGSSSWHKVEWRQSSRSAAVGAKGLRIIFPASLLGRILQDSAQTHASMQGLTCLSDDHAGSLFVFSMLLSENFLERPLLYK